MLDSIVTDYYLESLNRPDLRAATQDKKRAASTGLMPLEGFRADLESAWPELTELRHLLAGSGFPVTQLRILEVLIWMLADP